MKRTIFKKNGFTLIELLVVTTIVVLLLLSVSTVFMTFLISGARNNIMREIKAEGAEIIDKLEFTFRGASNLTGPGLVCNANGLPIKTLADGETILIDVNGTPIPLEFVDNGVSDRHIELNNQVLNSTFVLSAPPQINCYRDATTQRTTVRITFTLSRDYEDVTTLQQTFTALIQLRNS